METDEKLQGEQAFVLTGNEEKDRKTFLQDLNKFMLETGKPLSKVPIMGYKELDLFQLFREVQSFGGFNEVVKNVGTWSKIWKRLGNFDPSITDSSFRLKKNYERYLLEYEYKTFPDHKNQASDLDKQKKPNGLNSSALLSSSTELQPTSTKSRNSGEKSTPAATSKIPITKTKNKKTNPREGARSSRSAVKMPLVLLDNLTVENLGEVIPHFPFVTDKYVYPIGFKSITTFASMVNPAVQVRYSCEIMNGGNKPQFVITAADVPQAILADSPKEGWAIVLKRLVERGCDPNAPEMKTKAAVRFGISHPVVSKLIRELPNADKISVLDAALKIAAFTDGSKKRFLDSESSSEGDMSERSPKEMCVDEPMNTMSTDSAAALAATSYPEAWSREEMDDLESAVATLQALKNTVVFKTKA